MTPGQARAAQWAAEIKAKDPEEYGRLRQFAENEPKLSANQMFLFFCGLLLGPPETTEVTSDDLGNPLPATERLPLEERRKFWALGVQARVSML